MGAYLQRSRHGTIFYFRRKLPIDLRPRIKAPQLFISLGTADRSVAMLLARRAATRCDELFHHLRTMADTNTNEELMRILRDWQRTYPLREEIWRLRDEATEAMYQRNKAMRTLESARDEHAEQLVRVTRAAGAAPVVMTKPMPADTMKLSQAIKAFLARRDMKPRSRKRFSSVLPHFEKFLGGETWLHEVTQARISDYADAVNAVPTWSTATKKLYITIAVTMLRWHKARGRPVDVTVTAGTLILKRTTPAAWDRDAVTVDQLGVMFHHVAAFYRSEPHWFWATVLPAFTGSRIEEITQLDLAGDIKHDKATDRWYIAINEIVGPGGHRKSVKKDTGWRVVPIHPELVRLGLIKFVQAEKKAGARTPFERQWEPLRLDEPDMYNFAHGATKRGSRVMARMKASGEMPKGTASWFHSLRHSFISQLAAKGVPAEMRCAITGHKPGGGINATVYSKLRDQIAPKVPVIEGNLGEYVEQLRDALKVAANKSPR